MHSYHIPTGHPRAAAGCVEQSLPRRFTTQTQMNHSHIHAHEGSDNKMGWCTVPRAKSESNAVPLRTALWGRALQLEARQARRCLQLSTQESLLRAGQECFNTEHEHWQDTTTLPISPAAFWRWVRRGRKVHRGGKPRAALGVQKQRVREASSPYSSRCSLRWQQGGGQHTERISLFLLAPKEERKKKGGGGGQRERAKQEQQRGGLSNARGKKCLCPPLQSQTRVQPVSLPR